MKITNRLWRFLLMPLALAGMLSMSSAAELNTAALVYKLPDQIPVGSGRCPRRTNRGRGRRSDQARFLHGL